jgi:hypothetical protein
VHHADHVLDSGDRGLYERDTILIKNESFT